MALATACERHHTITTSESQAGTMTNQAAAENAPYIPATGDRVRIGGGKAIWIIKGFPTLHNGLKVAALTREGTNGSTNTTVETERLKPAPAETAK